MLFFSRRAAAVLKMHNCGFCILRRKKPSRLRDGFNYIMRNFIITAFFCRYSSISATDAGSLSYGPMCIMCMYRPSVTVINFAGEQLMLFLRLASSAQAKSSLLIKSGRRMADIH